MYMNLLKKKRTRRMVKPKLKLSVFLFYYKIIEQDFTRLLSIARFYDTYSAHAKTSQCMHQICLGQL